MRRLQPGISRGTFVYTFWQARRYRGVGPYRGVWRQPLSVRKTDALYERLIAPAEDMMLRIVSRIVAPPEDAEDVLQEVLAVIWRKLPSLDRHPNPQAYILRICLSCSVDHLRRRRRRREVPLRADEPEPPRSPTDNLATHETIAAVREAIRTLPPKQAQAVLLHALDGSSYAVIGEVLGCAEQTARSHFSKGIARLRDTLERTGVYCKRRRIT